MANRAPFSEEEDAALERGVEQHGQGNWKAILEAEPALACRNNERIRNRWKVILAKRAREEEAREAREAEEKRAAAAMRAEKRRAQKRAEKEEKRAEKLVQMDTSMGLEADWAGAAECETERAGAIGERSSSETDGPGTDSEWDGDDPALSSGSRSETEEPSASDDDRPARAKRQKRERYCLLISLPREGLSPWMDGSGAPRPPSHIPSRIPLSVP